MSDAQGVAIVVQMPDFEAAQARLRRLGNAHLDELFATIGSEVENQTRRRIQSEKTAPDGTPWTPWTEGYKATRRRGKKLLQSEGHLLDSVQSHVLPEGVEVGSNLIYARIHQLGGEPVNIPIPARPYLGLSAENASDIESLVGDFLEATLGAP